jgi:hypothetical protein
MVANNFGQDTFRISVWKTTNLKSSARLSLATGSKQIRYDTKPKRHYPASFPERMQLHQQLIQSTTRNQNHTILHHFRRECNCTNNFSRVRHETKKTLSCIISGNNAIAPTTFPEYDTKPKRHYPASFPERMQLQHQLFQSTTRNQKDTILHHFRKERNCTNNFSRNLNSSARLSLASGSKQFRPGDIQDISLKNDEPKLLS